MPDQLLQQLVAVYLADEASGAFVVRDIGRVFGKQVTDDLIDGIVPFSLSALYTVVSSAFIS